MVQKSDNQSQYLLSIIIPMSRMAGRLQNFAITMSNLCLEKDIQVILIHDIQDSKTGSEIRNILKLQPSASVTFVEEYFGSPGAARNQGINHIKGTWVNFVDSDDVYFPSDLIKILRKQPSLDAHALISNYETVDSVSNVVSLHEHQKSMTKVALQPGLWRWTFLAESIGNTRFSSLSMGEDQKFLYEFCQQKKQIYFADFTTYRYTTNQEFQLTNQRKPRRDLFQVLTEILHIRRVSQTNFDEFTETMILKLFISSVIHSTLRKKMMAIVVFSPILIPISKVRLRFKQLALADWYL
jgi:glycosyltransferase involved in cell wall biosynthesis